MSHKVARLALPLTLALVAALVHPGCYKKTYCVRRSAFVPIPAPSLRPARQADGYVEANIGSETAAYVKPPKKLKDANVGLYVPREQLSGYLLFSPHRAFSLGISYEAGFANTAMPISEGVIKPPVFNIGGTGLHMALNVKASERVTIGWSCDAWFYGIASRVNYIQISDGERCEDQGDPNTWSSKQTMSYGFTGRTQLAVGLDFKWSYLTFGAGVRNQFHNVDKSQEDHYTSYSISPRISSTAYPYVFLSWEFRATDWLHIGATVFQPLFFDPVIYAPIFGVNIRVTHLAAERTTWKGPDPTPVPVTPFR